MLPAAVIRGEYGSVAPTLEQEWRWMGMVRLLCIWSSRLRASASYCKLLSYNTTTDDSSMLCYHEGLETKCKLDTAIELC